MSVTKVRMAYSVHDMKLNHVLAVAKQMQALEQNKEGLIYS